MKKFQPVPIGINNYRKMKEQGFYSVDKTLMIQDFLTRKAAVTLITRPRRFGKTINMSMMAEFFDITKDSKDIFKDTAIMNTEFAKELNQHPTIFISFAECKYNKRRIIKGIKEEIRREYKRYKFVFEQLDEFDRPSYEYIVNGLNDFKEGSLDSIDNSLKFLMSYMREYYGKNVMLFIDEYDTPFIEAHTGQYYEEIHSSLASLLSTALKSSNDLQFAMLTGIQRVAKENIFSGLNNLIVCTINDSRYASYFGFTEDETKEMLNYYEMPYNDAIKSMYNGYHIGGVDIYNPWSIVSFIGNKELLPYWVNTSSNEMIKKALSKCDQSFKDDYEALIHTGFVETLVNFETSFYEVENNSTLWGLLANAGYLTIHETLDQLNGVYRLRIPNNEVKQEFKKLTAYYLHVNENSLLHVMVALKDNKLDKFILEYQKILLSSTSSFDFKDENSYHMLLLGMCQWLDDLYEITSNIEHGLGRYDILMKSKRQNHPSILIEMKYTKDDKQDLNELATQGINQIRKKQYGFDLQSVVCICLAHHGKQVAMKTETLM